MHLYREPGGSGGGGLTDGIAVAAGWSDDILVTGATTLLARGRGAAVGATGVAGEGFGVAAVS